MNENAIIEGVVLFFVIVGTVITLFASLGVIRLPDVYTRAHATTKSATLGILFILLGAFIHFIYSHQIVSVRLLLAIVFVFLTAPVAGHLIIRSAHRSGVPLAEMSVQDDLQDDLDRKKQELEAEIGSRGTTTGSLEVEKRGAEKEQDDSEAGEGGSETREDASKAKAGETEMQKDGSSEA